MKRFCLTLLACTSFGAASPLDAGDARALLLTAPSPVTVPPATAEVRSVLLARGFVVDERPDVPPDLRAYCCVWDLRFSTPLSNTELDTFLAFIRDGHGVVFIGENPGCCKVRNSSIDTFLRTWALGGSVRISLADDIPGTSVEDVNSLHPIGREPTPVSRVTYDGSAAGVFDGTGNGMYLTLRSVNPRGVAAVWDEGRLAAAPAGRVVVVNDHNWLVDTIDETDNRAFLGNIAAYTCPGTDSSLDLVIDTPPGFSLECPATLRIDGSVQAIDAQCLQATRLAVAGFAAPVVSSIAVSVNGGPFSPVTTTVPFLPALPPVTYAALGVPLVPGNNTITVRARDDSLRESIASLTGSVTDTRAPVIDPSTCLEAAIPLDATCAAAHDAYPAASDLCDPSVSFTSTPPLPFVFTGPGSRTFAYTATDDSGNAASCSRLVRALDLTPPELFCAPATTVECSAPGGTPRGDPAVQAFLRKTAASDNCGTPSLSNDAPPLLPADCSPGHATEVTWTALDTSANLASCTAALTVVDSEPPVHTSTPAPLALECSSPGGVPVMHPGVVAFLGQFLGVDVCSASVTGANDAPALLPAGCPPAGFVTTVRHSLADPCGNVASAAGTIAVVDSIAPVIAPPAPIVLECSAAGGVPVTDPRVQAWLASATATDLCGAAPVSTAAPPLFTVGCGPGLSTSVTFTATDGCSNSTSAASGVTVRDTTAPTLVLPPPLVVECNSTGGLPSSDPAVVAWLKLASAADRCGTATLSNDLPAFLPAGCGAGQQTVVTFTATDGCGNSRTGTAGITVRDTTAPDVSAPAPVTLECNGPGGIPAPDPAVQAWLQSALATDACGAATLSDDAPALLPAGCGAGTTTTVTFTALDACGNPASKPSTITVKDTTAPAVVPPPPLAIECDGPGGVSGSSAVIQAWRAAATAADLCGTAALTDDTPALLPSGCVPGHVTTVRFSAVDGCGNSAARDSTVTVSDTTPPALAVPLPVTLECSAPGGVPSADPAIRDWLGRATASDVCDGATLAHDAPAFFPSGCGTGSTTNVSFQAADDSFNLAKKGSSVTVRDTTGPTLRVPPVLTLECNSPGGVRAADPRIQAWLASAAASDVCDGATVTNDAPSLFPAGCLPGLATSVTFTAVDDCGNATRAASTVIVVDSTPPEVAPPAFDGACLWPPNHKLYCVDDVAAEVHTHDVCDPDLPHVQVVDCRSSQPEDSTGEGAFAPDCTITDTGRGFCVRAERAGDVPDGRAYTIDIAVTDRCGNAGAVTARIVVPRDQHPDADCRSANRDKTPRE